MWGPGLPLRLLLGIMGLAVSWTIAEVVAPSNLSAEVGRPLTLSCNVTAGPQDIVVQVRWLNKHGRTLVSYEPSVPVRISQQDPDVQLTWSLNGTSSITMKRLQPNHEGCYRCIFDVYPRGQQEGQTCVSVTGKLRLQANTTAVKGRSTSLSCGYSLPGRVQQVLWRKTAEQGDTTTVASYAKDGHRNVEEEFRSRVDLSGTLGDTRLSIHPVQMEDEACYTCEFHTYPDGTRSGTTCLWVYVLPEPEVTYVTSPSGVVEANCTARSRPAADIMWNVGGDNRTLGPPVSSSYDQGDGTTVVTSTVSFQSGQFSDGTVQCTVHHQGLDKPLSVSLNMNVGPAVVVLLSCVVAALLLLCLCVCFCKCFICTSD